MSTQPVSVDRQEITRKNAARIESEILRRLAHVTQVRAAELMGIDPSTLSRQKENLEQFCMLLSAVGLQVSPKNSVVTTPHDQKVLKRWAANWLLAEVENEDEA
ncbi:lambda phage CII family protein [Achromobacter xylosoxidans]|uniref:lambda phage CII family protein n=1 Tax=Alcaligenes xylosoxydans xylosoxydans TaxID=85698 RepID=UPI0021C000F5|nr:lambda phage CII family protein [Achromobacter xylosoxidans]UXL06456.1 lambda phage CII family protein [Achromobacter xylosoxidans]